MFEKYTKKEIIEAKQISNNDMTFVHALMKIMSLDGSLIPFNVLDYICRNIDSSEIWVEKREDFESKFARNSIIPVGMQPKTPSNFFEGKYSGDISSRTSSNILKTTRSLSDLLAEIDIFSAYEKHKKQKEENETKERMNVNKNI